MPKLHWEDFQPGAVAVYGPRLVTREEIVAFAAEFDPQPMHLDEAAASATLLGGLGRLGLAHLLPADAHDRRRLHPRFQLHGRDPASTRCAGSSRCGRARSIRVRSTVLDTRASGSRPEMGLVKFRFEVIDETDATLTTLATTLMFGRRAPGARP